METPSAAAPSRAPLLWFLLPLSGSYIAASFMPSLPPVAVATGALLCAIAALAALKAGGRRAPVLWNIFFLSGSLLSGWSYHLLWSDPAMPEWQRLPPREAIVDMVVVKPFDTADRYGRVSGLARIRSAPDHLADLVGRKVFYSLKTHGLTLPPVKSEEIRARGILTYLDASPDADPFEEFLRQSDIHLQLQRGSILETTQPAHRFFQFCRNRAVQFEAILRQGDDPIPDIVNTYVAMLLGRKSALSQDQKDRYLASGTMHLFAISGLHVGVVALTLSMFFTVIRLPDKLSAFLALTMMLFYVAITGGAPSAIRAFLMIFFFWTSKAFMRQPAPFSALVASALVVLIIHPTEIRSAGFRLSYAVVASILLYGLPLTAYLKKRIHVFEGLPPANWTPIHHFVKNRLSEVAGIFAISLAAIIASSPLTIHYFHLFTPGALFLNMVLLPLASLLVACGVISLLTGILHLTVISGFINYGAWVILAAIHTLIGLFLKLPGYHWEREFIHPLAGSLLLVTLLGLILLGHTRLLAARAWRFTLPPVVLLAIVLLATVHA